MNSISDEELLLRRLASAGHGLCLAALSAQEQAAAERLQDMGFVSFDACVTLTDRGQAMISSLQVN